MDYGFTHYTVVLLFAEDSDGVVHVLDEHAERQWLVPHHAEAVRAMLARWGIPPRRLFRFVAGGDCFSARLGGAATIADQWASQGLSLDRARDDRVMGATEVLRRLGDPDAASDPALSPALQLALRPTLLIYPGCRRLIECLPMLRHDPHRPEDVLKVDTDDDGLGGDDAYDALRYGLMVAAVPDSPGPFVYRLSDFQTLPLPWR
jgi:hypothetical protein